MHQCSLFLDSSIRVALYDTWFKIILITPVTPSAHRLYEMIPYHILYLYQHSSDWLPLTNKGLNSRWVELPGRSQSCVLEVTILMLFLYVCHWWHIALCQQIQFHMTLCSCVQSCEKVFAPDLTYFMFSPFLITWHLILLILMNLNCSCTVLSLDLYI